MPVRDAPDPLPLRLKKLRKERKLTQERLAEIIGVSHGTISRLETGVFGATPAMLRLLASALSVKVADLVDGEDPPSEVFSVWDRISESKRAQALRVLETFADQPEAEAAKPRKKK